MNRPTMAAITCAIVLIALSPLIVRGVENFKTFLELSSLLNTCAGAGSPPPCHDRR